MSYNTTVINLWGGPSVRKSTLAAKLYCLLKEEGVSSELVREYVKDLAWEGRKMGTYDQPMVLGNQIHSEANKYGKVAVIVTDSPLMLGPFYQEYYHGTEYVSAMVKGHLEAARRNGVRYVDFMVPRTDAYDPEGRYENEAEALAIDEALRVFLIYHGIDYETLPVNKHTQISRLRSAAKI